MNTDARDCRRPANAGRSSRVRFIAVGLDHTTARIELREQLAFADAEIPPALQRLTDPTNRLLDQAAILSTCNRIELYGVARWRPDDGQLASFLAHQRGLDTSAFTSALCVYRDDEVPQRLAATAAGMHSLVLGEPQIQGQTRQALELALSAGTAGAELRRLFELAIAAGRQVRSQTAIGRGVASVPQVSVELGCPLSVNVRRDAHHRGINDLEGENGERRTCWRRARMELGQRMRLPPATMASTA